MVWPALRKREPRVILISFTDVPALRTRIGDAVHTEHSVSTGASLLTRTGGLHDLGTKGLSAFVQMHDHSTSARRARFGQASGGLSWISHGYRKVRTLQTQVVRCMLCGGGVEVGQGRSHGPGTDPDPRFWLTSCHSISSSPSSVLRASSVRTVRQLSSPTHALVVSRTPMATTDI